MPDRQRSPGLSLYVAVASVVLLAPVAIVCILSFAGEGFLHFPPRSYSLHWFAEFFGDNRWRQSLLASTLIASIASAIATVVGFMAAYALVRGELKAKKIILSFMLVPMIIPTVITAIALYFLTAKIGLIGNVVWIGFCHALIALPIVLLIMISALQGVDINLERVALSLGASRLRVFMKVVVPIALPGALSAALFAFLASFDELIISLFLAGARAQTLPVRIWNSLHLDIQPVIAAASAVLIAVTSLVLIADGVVRWRRSRRMGSSHS
jgi:putative spermidine/putrescine transport system permease protein